MSELEDTRERWCENWEDGEGAVVWRDCWERVIAVKILEKG